MEPTATSWYVGCFEGTLANLGEGFHEVEVRAVGDPGLDPARLRGLRCGPLVHHHPPHPRGERRAAGRPARAGGGASDPDRLRRHLAALRLPGREEAA